MKATIRFTMFDPHGGRLTDEAIVRVEEITHCVPQRGGYTVIMLTTGGSITAADTIDELERKIDEAEDRQPATAE